MSRPPADPAPIGEDAVLARAPTAGEVTVGDDHLLVDERTGGVHALNPTASLVWECLDGETPLATIVDDLHEVFTAPRDRIAADVLALTRDLEARGFLAGVSTVDDAAGGTPDPPAEAPALPGAAVPDDRYVAAPPDT